MMVLDDDYLNKYDIISINSVVEGTFTPKISILYKDGKIVSFNLGAGVDSYGAIDYQVKEQYILTRPKKIEKIMKRIFKK